MSRNLLFSQESVPEIILFKNSPRVMINLHVTCLIFHTSNEYVIKLLGGKIKSRSICGISFNISLPVLEHLKPVIFGAFKRMFERHDPFRVLGSDFKVISSTID